ncbi:hypothetical protein GF354_00485 [Candidatus Peregrinibacteria bacterium]|nr:hypothetical protein [Candidatus Peregrinibacteria bacterium]
MLTLNGKSNKKTRKFATDYSFTNLSESVTQINKIKKFVKSVKGKYQNFLVLGIGGSALGAKCLQHSLAYKENKLIVLDNIDPDHIANIEEKIDPKKTLFIVISKSGNTTETVALYEYFKTKAPKENFVFISGEKNETLKSDFHMPEDICGRFSILTPVGLLPAALIGINIEKIIEGAVSQINAPSQANNFAQIQFESEKPINVIMPYSQKLTALADWYRQLLAESIGKEGKGITPVLALGATDQHSQLQLYNDGPADKLIIFLETEKFTANLPEFSSLMKIEKDATEKSLKARNITIKIKQIDEKSIGELIMFFELSITFLAEMMGVNAFDQPGVENTKKLIKNSL